ncbi:MAG: T9SS type A sorting domain-containing protein [Saprospiraceae bacterium]|nr:T9SS type A sorting domain-containing protein [Saprospiraceae bacterium]
MKLNFYFIALCSLLLNSSWAQAQSCVPDVIFQDSTFGVYPLPESETNPTGGINTSACINHPYDFTFTTKIPESIVYQGLNISIDSFALNPTTGLTGLPVGMTYNCNPPNCVFPKNSLGCLKVSGTATSANSVGDYSLNFSGKAYSPLAPGGLIITFPNPLLAPGFYILTLEAENSSTCYISYNEETNQYLGKVSIAPNPANGITTYEIESIENGEGTLSIFDINGRLEMSKKLSIYEGKNYFSLDVSNFINGTYFSQITVNNKSIVNKLIVLQ